MNAPDKSDVFFPFDNSYARLPDRFFARLDPVPVSEPRLIKLNKDLARLLSLDPDQLSSPAGVEVLAGNRVPEGSDPLAMAYAGHQFGNWVPQLGDGRAILLGEVVGTDGVRRDIQLKGSGRTPFSRMGDGRAVLGPILREYVVAEGMAALGVPTTRALAAVLTGEKVARESFLPGAVLTRVAQSHIRVGTFQFFAARRDEEALKVLADHVIERHYSDAAKDKHPYLSLLRNVMTRQAELVARWQLIGFIHGVMNTDNMSIAGETIDYGPCAFMDTYHPNTVYSSIDQMGRYAYSNQPRIAHWNLAIFAQSLLPLFDADQDKAIELAQGVVDTFPGLYDEAYLTGLRAKLGLSTAEDGDRDLADDLLTRMAENEADFTLTFRGLSEAATLEPTEADAQVRAQFNDGGAFDSWAEVWRARLSKERAGEDERKTAMRAVNPAFIPRNHLIAEVIAAAEEHEDFNPFEELMSVLSRPFEDQPGRDRFTLPPRPEQVVHRTFCGT